MNSLVSIIVPVYNVETELERCVYSLVHQTYKTIEIILVDDGSTDSSGALCDALAEIDERISVVHKSNGGLSSARNAGLDMARGDWLLFVDSDDYIDLDACMRFIQETSKDNPDIIVGELFEEREGSRKPTLRHGIEEGRLYKAFEFVAIAIAHREFYAPVWQNCYKRSYWEAKGLRFAEGLLHEDMEIQPRLFLGASTVTYLSGPFYHYVLRDGSIMRSSNRDKRLDAMRKIYAEWKATFDSIKDDSLRRLLYGHLAKCYLYSCRVLHASLSQLPVVGVDTRFLYHNGLDIKEKAKALLLPPLLCLAKERSN